MKRIVIMTSLLLSLLASNAMAGGFYESPASYNSVVAPVQIKDKGLYNLVVSIQFLKHPYNERIYKSAQYDMFINRLKTEWNKVALEHILKAEELNLNELINLKSRIEMEVLRLAGELKKKYKLEDSVEVVYSIPNFYLLEPKSE